MEVAVIDKRTLQCVMSAEEIEEYGMDKKAIFKNDARVREFFSQVMKRAQRETGYYKDKGAVAVQASFLPDESVEITFCVGEDNSFYKKEPDWEPDAPHMRFAVFKSRKLFPLLGFCRQMSIVPEADLYEYRGIYYLLVDMDRYEIHEVAVLFNLADEYVDEVSYSQGIVACLREHGRCLLQGRAVQDLRRI